MIAGLLRGEIPVDRAADMPAVLAEQRDDLLALRRMAGPLGERALKTRSAGNEHVT